MRLRSRDIDLSMQIQIVLIVVDMLMLIQCYPLCNVSLYQGPVPKKTAFSIVERTFLITKCLFHHTKGHSPLHNILLDCTKNPFHFCVQFALSLYIKLFFVP